MGFTACEEDITEPTPQSTVAEPTMTYDGLSVAVGSGISKALDLNTAGDSVPVITTTATPALRDGQSVQYVAYVASKEDFSDAKTIAVTDGKVLSKDVNTVFRAILGNTPKAKDMYFRFAAFLAYGDSQVRFGDASTYFATTKCSVTPLPSGITIDAAYYMVGDMFAWDAAGMKKFNHSSADVYDDPIFTLFIATPKDNCYWKIIKQTDADAGNIWASPWGTAVNGDDAASGTLTDANAQAGRIAKKGYYMMTLNMMERTYKIDQVNLGDFLYVIGNNNGWNINDGSGALDRTDETTYSGTVVMGNDGDNYFCFYTALGDFNTGSIGTVSGGNETLAFSGSSVTSSLSVNSQGCYVVPKGKYTITVDFAKATITFTKL